MWKFLLAQTKEAVPAVSEAVPAAEGATQQQPGPGGLFNSPMFLMIIVFFAVMYFFTIRPQKKREQEQRDMLNSLAKGDSVVTTGGICGSIVGVSDETVVLRVDENVTMEFVRSAVAQKTAGKEKKK